MAWFIAAALILFYLLGLFVFHGPTTLHLLPVLALLVIVVDQFLTRLFRRSD